MQAKKAKLESVKKIIQQKRAYAATLRDWASEEGEAEAQAFLRRAEVAQQEANALAYALFMLFGFRGTTPREYPNPT